MAKKSEGELYEVTLLKDHTHEGISYPASTTISVSASDREWLLAMNVISNS
ncbi:MAG: hypothetical protein ACI4NJ_00710 [Cellvibrio sp.]